MQDHIGNTPDNCMISTSDMTSIKSGVNSSRRLLFRAQILHSKWKDGTDHPTQASTTTGIGVGWLVDWGLAALLTQFRSYHAPLASVIKHNGKILSHVVDYNMTK